MSSDQTRTYGRAKCVVFLKTNEAFGGLSNMAGGYPLIVNGVRILTSEALYQVCRFPLLPEVQRLIIEQKSPMSAKMKSKPHRKDTRLDWDQVRVNIMRWCLRVKLAQNWNTFSKLLLDTGEKSIVEQSKKDDFWGAKPVDNQTLVGRNVLGRLLMELREAVKNNEKDALLYVEPLTIPDFLLYGRPIQKIFATTRIEQELSTRLTESVNKSVDTPSVPFQSNLFDPSPVNEVTSTYLSAHQPKTPPLSSLKPFPEYKETELPWLGKVPVHWRLIPAFGAFRPNHENNRGMKEKTVLSLSYGRIVIKPIDKLHGLVPESFETYQIVNPGDIVLRTTDLQNDHTSLRVGMVRNRGIITSAYLALKMMDGVIPEFGFQFLNVWDTTKAIYGYGSGLRQNLDFVHFKRMPVALPPPEEQRAIVRFLNWINKRMHRTIQAKRKLIDLLNEQKQTIIHRAVTRGLDPTLPLKPSGIAWLGHIPQHWAVRKLRSLFRVQGSGTTPSGDRYYGGSIRWVMSGDLNDSTIMITKRSLHRSALTAYSTLKLYPAKSLVVAMYGATIGKTGILESAACTNQACCVLSQAKPDVNESFIQMVLHCAKPHLLREAYGGGQPNINANVVCSLRVPFPSFEEQNSLVAHITKMTSGPATTIARLEREIELLHEYRTRLVADVVTGKLDVRETAAKLPEEEMFDETDAIDEAEISDEELAV